MTISLAGCAPFETTSPTRSTASTWRCALEALAHARVLPMESEATGA